MHKGTITPLSFIQFIASKRDIFCLAILVRYVILSWESRVSDPIRSDFDGLLKRLEDVGKPC
jgi:hypothetical protein